MARHAGQRRRADAVADPDRRRLLKAGLGAAGAIAAAGTLAQGSRASPVALDMTSTGPDEIPRRPLGRTGQQVSILGLGGYHLGTVATATEAIRLVHQAADAGVRFFDNAWEYNGGRSEEWMGQALQDGSPGSLAGPRSHLRERPGPPLRQGRRHRRPRPGEEGGKGPLRRVHRPQEPGDPPEDAGARLSVRHRADAAQLLRRDVSKLRAAGPLGARATRHRGARHEEPRG